MFGVDIHVFVCPRFPSPRRSPETLQFALTAEVAARTLAARQDIDLQRCDDRIRLNPRSTFQHQTVEIAWSQRGRTPSSRFERSIFVRCRAARGLPD